MSGRSPSTTEFHLKQNYALAEKTASIVGF